MTDDLKERLKVVACCDTDSTMRHFAYAFMEQDPDGDYVTYAAAKARITDLEARLAAAEAGEDALAAGLRALWFHDAPHSALAAYEARRKGK